MRHLRCRLKIHLCRMHYYNYTIYKRENPVLFAHFYRKFEIFDNFFTDYYTKRGKNTLTYPTYAPQRTHGILPLAQRHQA